MQYSGAAHILLDTHAAIWFFEDIEKLSKSAADAIYNLDNIIYISIASIWEIAIKLGTGKLSLNGSIDDIIEAIYKNDFNLIDVSLEHIKMVRGLPLIHRDPFDRMIVAQAIVEDMAIMTIDENIFKYDIDVVW